MFGKSNREKRQRLDTIKELLDENETIFKEAVKVDADKPQNGNGKCGKPEFKPKFTHAGN